MPGILFAGSARQEGRDHGVQGAVDAGQGRALQDAERNAGLRARAVHAEDSNGRLVKCGGGIIKPQMVN